MDILKEHYDEYITHLYEKSSSIVKRNTAVCFYDCTNYYFEIESPDDDYVDEVTGEFIKGFRKYDLSKQHQPNPLVEMGLFMDADGIPLSMCLTSGSDNEQTTAIPLEKRLTKMLRGKKFIYCADAGLGSLDIRRFNSMGGRAFIITQSIKKLSDIMKTAVFNDCDYQLLSTNKPISINDLKTFDRNDPKNKDLYLDKAYKIIHADKLCDLGFYEEKLTKNGRKQTVKAKGTLKQHLIITFSRKTMEYQRFIRNRQIEPARKLLIDLDPDTYKKGPHDVTRFIKRTTKTKSGEQATDLYEIDQRVIDEEEKYDGYYTALLIFRLLEKKLDLYGTHFTVENIIETLKNMNVANIEDLCYMSTYTCSQTCMALNAVFDLGLDKKYYQPKELNKKIKKISG